MSGRCDVLALVRGGGGGGSAPFSEEVLVRAVAATHTPVVVGVGHGLTPIAELAGAVAHTPTHAAELIFPDLGAHAERLDHLGERLGRPLRQLIASERQRLVIGEHRLRGATLDRLATLVAGQRTTTASPRHTPHSGYERHQRPLRWGNASVASPDTAFCISAGPVK